MVKNKKSKVLTPVAKDATPAAEEDFYIQIPKEKLIELDNFLQQVPHGIAMQIVGFMKQFERISA